MTAVACPQHRPVACLPVWSRTRTTHDVVPFVFFLGWMDMLGLLEVPCARVHSRALERPNVRLLEHGAYPLSLVPARFSGL
jgi:hypothetical protein